MARGGEVRRFEHGRAVSLPARGPAVTTWFERGSAARADGTTRQFTGPAPAGWAPAMPPPPLAPALADVAAAVADLRSRIDAPVELAYWARADARVVSAPGLVPRSRAGAVWALTGRMRTAGGAELPIGMSGAGDGLATVRDERTARRLGWIAGAVERARSTPSHDGPVLLGRQAAALVVHEAIGHLAEAEPPRRGGLGARVAGEAVSVDDDPGAPRGPARYAVDDDGVRPLSPTRVVRDGVLVGELHSAGSARAAGTVPTANGRAASAWHEPLPRMSNLICRAGSLSDDELADRLWSGVLVHVLSDGWASGADIGARIVLAEDVWHGRRTGRYTTGGRIRDRAGALLRVAELGTDPAFSANAMCGKRGQLLCDVGTAAPPIRFERLAIEA
jgi:hypothetical protein